MISLNEDMPIEQVRPGLSKRIPKHDKAYLGAVEWRIEPGMTFDPHPHEDEATMHYIVQGKVRILVGSEEKVLEAGCYYFTPPGVPHGVMDVTEPTIEIIISTPVHTHSHD